MTGVYVQQVQPPRTPVALVILTMDYCSLTFGVGACTATGEKCFNTYPTCKLKSAYSKTTKDYKFTSADVPIPFALVRPYVRSVKLLPTEIKEKYTVAGRVSCEMLDEPDGDVGIDPYVTGRTAFPNIPGTYWKKWLIRNSNYKNRRIKVYEGWVGEAEGSYDLRWTGKLETVKYDRGVVKIEAADLLKDLSKTYIPPKMDCKLRQSLEVDTTSFYVSTGVTGLPASSGTIRIGDEIMTYSAYDSATGIITGATRAQYDTTAATASSGTKVQVCRVFVKDNPFDIMQEILSTDVGMEAGDIDSSAFATWRDYPDTDLDVGPCVVSEPVKASDLYAELLAICNAKSWQNEANKITVCRDIASIPLTRSYSLSDADTLKHGSAKVDMNEKSRLTRVWLYWDKTATGKTSDNESYRRLDVAIAAEAEGASSYGEIVDHKIYSRFLVASGQVEETVAAFARNICGRMMVRNIEASPVIVAEVELKDEEIKTGDFVNISTDELLSSLGEDTNYAYQVVKRDKADTKLTLSFLRASTRKIAHVAPNAQADYTLATDAQREKYGFASDAAGLMSNYDQGFFAY